MRKNDKKAEELTNKAAVKLTQELFLLTYEECYDEEIIPVDYQTITAEQRRDRRLLVQRNDPNLKILFQQKEFGAYKLWVKNANMTTRSAFTYLRTSRPSSWIGTILSLCTLARSEWKRVY